MAKVHRLLHVDGTYQLQYQWVFLSFRGQWKSYGTEVLVGELFTVSKFASAEEALQKCRALITQGETIPVVEAVMVH